MKPYDKDQCFAILRLEREAVPNALLENFVTVKLIVWSMEEAEQEVARLNVLNADKGCRYFWQTTRAKRR